MTMIKQNLLSDLSYFVNGLSNFHWNVSSEHTQKLVKYSLVLLEDIPVCRELVFEFFSLVFEISVANYVKVMDVSNLKLLKQ